MGETRRGHGYFKGAATKAMAGAAALLVGTALMGSAALAGGGEPPAPPTSDEPTTTTLAPPTTVAAVPAGPGVADVTAFTKVFNPDTILPGDPSTLTYTIEGATTNLDFTDNLPTGLTVATAAGATQCVTGTLTTTAPSTITFIDGESTVVAPCTFSVAVTTSTSLTPGDHVSETGTLTASAGGGGTATATLTVDGPPVFSKVFSPSQIIPGGVSTLTYTIDNAGNGLEVVNLDFVDPLPAGVTVATIATTPQCGGTVVAAVGATLVDFTGGTVAAGASCSISVSVTSSTLGTHTSTTGDLTSDHGNSGTASATLTVAAGTATAVTTPPSSSGPALAGTGGSTTTLLAAIGTMILLFGALLVYGSKRRRLLHH